MARSRTISYAALNISADPHPPGTYPRVMNRIAQAVGHAHGSDRAKLTRAHESNVEGVYLGRIIVWTHLDPDAPWVDLETDEQLLADALEDINIPETYGPNARIFSFAFHERKHRLYFETRNEFGNTLGPKTMERLVRNIASGFSGLKDWPEITVTLVPRHGAVESILGLEKLRKLEIDLTVPNPDDDDAETRRKFYERMRKMKAKRWQQTLTKAAGEEKLQPANDIIEAAEAAAFDGEVKGWGQRDGRNVEISTKDTPRVEKAKLDEGENFAERIMGSAGFF